MDLNFSAEDIAFRDEVRAFLKDNWTDQDRKDMGNGLSMAHDMPVRWHRRLAEQGWAAPNWPLELGGCPWTPTQKYIFDIECANANCPRLISFGLNLVAPVLYTFGNKEQQDKYLPDILSAKTWWCQGYSEPGAGSDLAGLSTRAELSEDGTHYVVNGQKTWTSTARYADMIFCLVRTDPTAKIKQQGISFLLIDMKTPGITVKPISTLDGQQHVNDTFFDNVKVPVENRIGEENMGWTYAKLLLTHERTGIAGVARSKNRLEELKVAASTEPTGTGQAPLIDEPSFRAKVSQIEIDLMALEITDLRTLAGVQKGGAPGPESSILKVRGTEIQQAIAELFMDCAGYYSQPFVQDTHWGDYEGEMIGADYSTSTALQYFSTRPATVYGGSSEVQRNIISKAVLGLSKLG
ncbi:MAG: acyl-CoA dehydrogenase family protein [Pseudomonadales bacterium]|nr:acyl-CoA dehydrogenase family protein [Pseudomonadales bacterium]